MLAEPFLCHSRVCSPFLAHSTSFSALPTSWCSGSLLSTQAVANNFWPFDCSRGGSVSNLRFYSSEGTCVCKDAESCPKQACTLRSACFLFMLANAPGDWKFGLTAWNRVSAFSRVVEACIWLQTAKFLWWTKISYNTEFPLPLRYMHWQVRNCTCPDTEVMQRVCTQCTVLRNIAKRQVFQAVLLDYSAINHF